MPALRARVAAAAAALALAAGCAGPTDATDGLDCRWLLTTVEPTGDLATLREAIARRAGVPVLAMRPIAARQIAVTLGAADAAVCRDAADRIAADTTFAAGLQPDGRRALPARPAASAAR